MIKGDGKDLDAVIVTSLGIKRQERKLGYAATSVKTDELVTNRTINLGESLEGRVSGLSDCFYYVQQSQTGFYEDGQSDSIILTGLLEE
jgi:hypothetical protein